MKVALYQPDQIEKVKPILQTLHQEAMTHGVTPTAFIFDNFRDFAIPVLEAGIAKLFVLEDDDGEIMGILFAFQYVDFHLGGSVVAESLWYMFPEYRSHGLKLYQCMEYWAKKINAVFMTLGHFPQVNGPKMGRMYNHLGFQHFQEQYIKKV